MDIEKFLMIPGQTFSNMARGATYDELYDKINNLIPLLNQYYKENPNKNLDEDINNLIDDYSDFVDVLFAPRKGKKIDKNLRQKFNKLQGKLDDGYKYKNKHLTEKSIANPDDNNLALNILGVSGTTKKAKEDKEKFELEQKRLAEEKAERLRKQIEADKLKVEKETEELKKIATELGFVDNINFTDKSFNEMKDDFMSMYAKEFQHINSMYQKNRINASEFIKRYKKLNKYIEIYKTPLDIYKKPINRFDDFILESNKIYYTITKSAKSKIASTIKSGLQSKKRNEFQKDLDIIKQKILKTTELMQKPIEKIKKRLVIRKRTQTEVKEFTIRKHLNSLPITTLRTLARIHNKLYNIKIGQTKDELVESLAKQYERMTGTNLIHKLPEELSLIIPKTVRKSKPKSKKEILDELVEKEPETQIEKLSKFNEKNREALKEKVRKYREEREAKKVEAEAEEARAKSDLELEKLNKQSAKNEKARLRRIERNKEIGITPGVKNMFQFKDYNSEYLRKERAAEKQLRIEQYKLRKEREKAEKQLVIEKEPIILMKASQELIEKNKKFREEREARRKAEAEAEEAKKQTPPIQKLSYKNLTEEQQQQADKLIKKRETRKNDFEQIQKEMVSTLRQTQKKEKPQISATDKALQTLIEMGLINDKDFEKMNISKPQAINKKQEKFSYNRDFVDDSTIGQEQFKIMEKGQNAFDFYKTPQTIIDKITDSVISEFKKTPINILEPSAGLGSLMTGIINRQDELNINNLDANEFNEEMYNLLKENFKISHIYNKNFLKWTPEIKYDCVIMNPPYEGYVNEEVGRSKVAYLYHVMKAVLLGGNIKTIYAVLPPLKSNFPQFELEDVISKAEIKKMKNLFNIDEIPKVYVELVMEKVDGWKKVVFSRGKFNLGKAGLLLNLYKFIVF